MPIYDFQCLKCKTVVEKLARNQEVNHRCNKPKCGGDLVRIMSTRPPAFNFKNGQGTDLGNLMSIPGKILSR